MATDINEFAKQVEADLVAHDPTWAEAPFGTEQGILDQYAQTFDGIGTIFYYTVATDPQTNIKFRSTMMIELSRDDSPDSPDSIPIIPDPIPPEASDFIYYGHDAPETPALSPIWFDTQTGDIRIWYSFNGDETWINTGVAGVGKIEFLNDLQDVDVLTMPPADTNHLEFDSGENKWKVIDLYAFIATNYSETSHTHTYSLNDINDVTINNPKLGESLKYNGTNWYNTNENIRYTIIGKGGDFPLESSEGQNILYNVSGDYTITIPTASTGNFDLGETIAILCNTSGISFIITGLTVRIQASKQLLFLENDSIIYITYISDDVIHVSGSLANI